MTRGTPSNQLPQQDSTGPRRRWRGQSLVEFAIFIPVLLLILLVAIDLGRAYLGWVSLNNVVRVGANFAAQNPAAWQGSGNSSIQARYRDLMTNDARGINCTLPSPLPAPSFPDSSYTVGSRVRVSVTCSFRLLTPLLSNVVGDGAGNLPVSAASTFIIRYGSLDSPPFVGGGSATPSPMPTPEPTSSPEPSPTAEPTPTPSGQTPDPSASASPTLEPVVVSWYGTPTSADASGGGPPGTPGEDQIVGIPSLAITFSNTTTGVQGSCQWDFGDGGTSTSCSDTVNYSYTTRGTYTVSLTVNGQTVTRTAYVLVGCKVPAFAGVRVNSAMSVWTGAGFVSGNLTTLPGNGNYKIGYQSLAGGLVNPVGGCSGATIEVGP